MAKQETDYTGQVSWTSLRTGTAPRPSKHWLLCSLTLSAYSPLKFGNL
jgi:hypothetical protein